MANPKIEHFPRQDRDRDKASGGAGGASSPDWLHRVSFHQGIEPVLVLDSSNRAVIDANESAVQLTGYDRQELLDLRLEDLHPRSSREKVIHYFQKILDHANYVYDDIELETKNKGNIPVEVKAGVIGSHGKIVVQAIFRDISKERLLQKEVLFQNLKLSALNSLSSAISKSLNLSEILEDSLRAVMETSGSLYGEMLLYHDENRTFRLAIYRGEEIHPQKKTLPVETCLLAAQVMERGKPVLLAKLDQDPRLSQLLSGREDVAAVAGVPLRSKNRILGVMHLAIGHNQLFPTFDFDLFTSIGNQVGMAAENALLFQHTSAQAKQIKVLNNIARIISSSLQLEEVFDSFAHEMEKLIDFNRLSVAFLDESGSYLRIVASGSRTDSGWGMESIIPLVGTGPGWVVLNEKHFIEDQFLYEDGIRSYILLPLEARRRVVGTFGLGSRRSLAFSVKDLPLLTQLSKQISVAIENVKLYQKTKETSILDDVSSLFNFRYFHQALDRELKLVARHRSKLSLIFIDLDNFKQVNDTHGHLRGSRVLREVGFHLRAAVRETDIACRYGGDEFVVILPDTDTAAARRLGERIRAIILQHTYLREEGINARLGASIGIATYPTDAPTKEELIHLADEAMYRDKEKNKGKPIPRDS
jgi:diguanylate cyclase (GGDEF)-like protein/PAS domain S-box-containing protein